MSMLYSNGDGCCLYHRFLWLNACTPARIWAYQEGSARFQSMLQCFWIALVKHLIYLLHSLDKFQCFLKTEIIVIYNSLFETPTYYTVCRSVIQMLSLLISSIMKKLLWVGKIQIKFKMILKTSTIDVNGSHKSTNVIESRNVRLTIIFEKNPKE